MNARCLYFMILLGIIFCSCDYTKADNEYDYLVFKDDFEDLTAENWIMEPTDPVNEGSWAVSLHDGSNVLSLQGMIRAELRDFSLGNFTLQVDTKFVVFDQPGHICFREADPSNRYYIRYDGKDLRLVKNVDTPEEVEVVECSLKPETWYTIKVSCIGNRISVYIDDELYIDYVDGEDPILMGGLSIETGIASHLYFDNVVLFSSHDVSASLLLKRVEDAINQGRADGYDTSDALEKLDEAREAYDKGEYSLSDALGNDALESIHVSAIDEGGKSEESGIPFSFNLSIQTITGLITIGASLAGIVGWIYRRRTQGRRGRILVNRLFEEVDDVYSRFKMNAVKCESELIRLRGEILKEFKEGLLDEENFKTLDARIESYLEDIREEIKRETNS